MLEQPTPETRTDAEEVFCPHFLVVGVVKGGTTALYNLLDRHPGIHLPPIKETNFFSRANMRPVDFTREYALDVRLDVDAYIRGGMKQVVHIAHVNDAARYAALFAGARAGQVLGEVCPSYAICPSAAGAIHAARPDAGIFFMLRDPVQRAWSQYIMNLREGKTTERDFLLEVEHDSRQPKQGWGVNHQYLSLGLYADQVERYIRLFGKDRVQVLLHEQFKQDPKGMMRQVFAQIGVAPMDDMDVSGKFNEAAVPRNAALNRLLVRSGALSTMKSLVPRNLRGGFKNMLYSKKDLPQLSEEQARALWERYAADVDRLSTMLHTDLCQWWGPQAANA